MKKALIIFYVVVGIGTLISCNKDFLDENPKSFIIPENFFKNIEDAKSALFATYAATQTTGFQWNEGVQHATFYVADYGTADPGNANFHAMVDYAYTSNSPFLAHIWQTGYNTINKANFTIGNVQKMDSDLISEEEKNQIVGEARFLRAYIYLDLVRMFGDIPLVLLETETIDDVFKPVSTEAEIYENIIKDLEFAMANCPPIVRGSAEATGRVDRGAAQALLAKTYMNMAGFPLNQTDKWAEAHALLNDLISNAGTYGFGLQNNYLDAFATSNENGKEDVFSIQFEKGYGNAAAGRGSILHIIANQQRLRITPKLIFSYLKADGSLDDADERYLAIRPYRIIDGTPVFLGLYSTYTNPLSKDFPPGDENEGRIRQRLVAKFIEQEIQDNKSSQNDSGLNNPIIRWADVLLMMSETENEINGPTAMAYQYLNEVRLRSKAEAAPEGMLQEGFRQYILDERARELYAESSRWFDLKRSHSLIEEVQKSLDDFSGVSRFSKLRLPEEKNYYFPYPQDEVSFNPNIEQRPGY